MAQFKPSSIGFEGVWIHVLKLNSAQITSGSMTPNTPKSNSFSIASLLLAGCIGLIAVGCGSGIGSNNSGSSETTSTPAPTTSTDSNGNVKESPSATVENSQGANAESRTTKISEGNYWLGHSDEGLEVQGDRYRYYSEGGEQPWRSIDELKAMQAGVVYDGRVYWCLASMKPKGSIASCSEKGWVTKSASASTQPMPPSSANRALLFSCLTDNGKEILLYETDTTIEYSFGRPDETPELALQVPRDRASTWQWKGVGRWMSYAVDVPNGETTYSVFWGVDRLSKTSEIEAGVRVKNNGKIAATVNCASKVTSNLQGVKLQPTQY
ncbi:MAG: hypothetical protein B0A82_01865 [Alkalinema sp. CACIAM 70d]|nr:MAG: hypothetical protein B0A82_01865 [Alkalinema sp. CACIAM 70d]